MSQFDFGTMDPYVVGGVQLADSLNQWRSALHSMHRGASRPSYAVAGMMWINDSGGAASWIVNVYMGATVGDKALFSYDTTTGAIIWNSGIPAGVMWDFAGGTAPLGFYLCDGSLKNRVTDAPLFTAISTTFGAGDGSTTFGLPDCRGRVTAGPDGGAGRLGTGGAYPGGITSAILGASGGEQGHILSTAELAAHNHTATDSGHTHGMSGNYLNVNSVGSGVSQWTPTGTQSVWQNTTTGTGNAVIGVSNTGSSSTHNNTQPTIIVNKIIKR